MLSLRLLIYDLNLSSQILQLIVLKIENKKEAIIAFMTL